MVLGLFWREFASYMEVQMAYVDQFEQCCNTKGGVVLGVHPSFGVRPGWQSIIFLEESTSSGSRREQDGGHQTNDPSRSLSVSIVPLLQG